MSFQIVTNFGSPLVKLNLDAKLIEALNHASDQIVSKISSPQLAKNSNDLFSAVKFETFFPHQLVPEFERTIFELAKNYYFKFAIDTTEYKVEYRMGHVWIVSQREQEWGFLHSHSGSLSGIIYLKVPENMAKGLDPNDKRSDTSGCVTFAEGSPSMFRKAMVTIKPKVGELYLFPSDLMHTIYPMFGDEERRSLSFNVDIIRSKN